jgi:two-component system, chemotaxis family, sensor kinase CheA
MEFAVSAELVSIYLEDAREQLAVLDHVLLRLEREGAKPELMASVLGPLHTLKGNSGMIGLVAVKDYVHRLEEVFARGRDGVLALDRDALDQLFEAATALRDAIETACSPGSEQKDLGASQAALAALVARSAAAASPRAANAPAAAETATGPARSSMVRVDFSKLDHLLNLVGELIIYRTKLSELARHVAEVLPGVGPELLEAVHRVSSASTQLQETIMDVRMLPIRHVFERFPRLVRDLARQQGKRVELVLQGEDTRVDKAVIDELGEPLVHLIRNAVDHGI